MDTTAAEQGLVFPRDLGGVARVNMPKFNATVNLGCNELGNNKSLDINLLHMLR